MSVPHIYMGLELVAAAVLVPKAIGKHADNYKVMHVFYEVTNFELHHLVKKRLLEMINKKHFELSIPDKVT